jgi:hypothetical protein
MPRSSSPASRLFLLVAALLFLLPGRVVAGAGLPGVWEGTLEAGEQSIKLIVRIAADADGGTRAVLDSPDQGVQGLPIDALGLEGSTFSFALTRLNAGFRGEMEASGDSIKGEWSQGGGAVPLTLARTGPPPALASIEAVDVSQEIPAAGVPGKGLTGRWGAVLSAGATNLRLILAVTPAAAGGFTATVDNLDQGPIRMAVDHIGQEGDAVSFEMGRIDGAFAGTMSADGATIAGKWTQGGIPLDLVFLRLPARP